MLKNLSEKLLESIKSVLPFTIIVFVLHFTIAPLPNGTLMLFISGAILLVIGVAFFSLGADMAMTPMGEQIGAKLTQSRKIWLIIISCFLLGVAITVAEPDLQVLTKQVPSIPDLLLVGIVGVGVGLFLVIAVIRILFKISLSKTLIVLYALVFIVALFTAPEYLAIGFDSGGVTTGPITVPFILALGVGLSAVRGDKNAEEDSFGLVGICSIGPILAVLVLGIFYSSDGAGHLLESVSDVANINELIHLYLNGFKTFASEVFLALSLIVVSFVIFQAFLLKIPRRRLIRIGVGIIYTFIGLTIFLTGVNIGFIPAGSYLGEAIGNLSYNWILIPLSMVLGFFIIYAEPSVAVLNKQVEEITSGAISQKMMMTGLSIGVAIALALGMVRVMFGLSIWYFIIPGYGIALGLTFFVPKVFTAIAFDSGGVVSGAMATTFLLPFAMGVCSAFGGNPMIDAFGIIAIISMMPLITIQIMGVIYKMKMKNLENTEVEDYSADYSEVISLE